MTLICNMLQSNWEIAIRRVLFDKYDSRCRVDVNINFLIDFPARIAYQI